MTSPFMELIGSGEGDYNSYNGGTNTGSDGKAKVAPANQIFDFSQMSIAEIQRHQALPPGHHDRIFAVGKYQFVKDNLTESINRLHIDSSEKFTPEMQDRLCNDYIVSIKRWKIRAYITDKPGATLHDAQKATSLEWASVEDPDTPGHVYAPYEKLGNRMHTTAAQVAAALDEMRAEYKAQIDKGLSAEEAWQATANMGPGQLAHLAKAHTAKPHIASNVLHEGAYSPAVGELQTQLNNLGYTDASGRPLESDNHFGSATRTAVENFQRDHGLAGDGAVGPATRAALGKATQTVASANLDANAIRTLQSHLHTLGVTDMNQQAVAITGVYDLPTRTAVARFQSEQGMPVTGHADEATRSLLQGQAFIANLQHPSAPTLPAATRQREPQLDVSKEQAPYAPHSGHISPATPESFLMFNDPSHPQHALYNTLKEGFPADTTPEWLAHATATCYKSGIRQPDDLGNVFGNGETIRFECNSLFGHDAFMDTTQPPPSVEQTMQGVQQYDQQQAQMMGEIRAQNAQINAQAQQGPVLGGPPMH